MMGRHKKAGINLFACHARSWDPDADNEQEKRAPATKCGAILIGGQHRYAKCYHYRAQYELAKETDRPTINRDATGFPSRLVGETPLVILNVDFVSYDSGRLSL